MLKRQSEYFRALILDKKAMSLMVGYLLVGIFTFLFYESNEQI